jgi:thioredoxin 1
MKVKKFYADWCGPCKALSMVIKNAGDKVTIPILELDIDHELMETVQYDIKSVPTMILVDDTGKELKRQVGSMTESQLLDFLKV